jgi:carbamoyl-phosphate synthase large subunit
LFRQGELRKVGCYERLEYFMAKTVISGVSGNISKGRLINDAQAVAVSRQAVEAICHHTGEVMHGLVTVDLRTDANDLPKVTEINLRQVAAASAFAEIEGANLAEAQALATLGLWQDIGPLEVPFPPDNRLFRDIDGLPVFVPHYEPLSIGQRHPSRH